MRYKVRWLRHAKNDLADIWTRAADREAVTAASYQIDQRLANDPANEGESREGDVRVTFERPLRVQFLVKEADRKVVVISVGDFS